MYPLNDKDLDRLSREAADQFDVEASATGWDQVEKRLDVVMPVKDEKDRRRFLLWLFFIALMTGGGLLWMLGGGKNNSINIAQHAVAAPNTTDNNKNNDPSSLNTKTTQASTDAGSHITQQDASTSKPDFQKATLSDAVSQKDATAKKSAAARNNSQQSGSTTLLATTNNKAPKAVQNNRVRNSATKKGNRTGAEITGVAGSDVTTQKAEVNNSNTEKTTNKTSDSKDLANNEPNAVVPPAAEPVNKDENKAATGKSNKDESLAQQSAPKKQSDKPSKHTQNPLEIGLLVGPDFSYVKFYEGSQMGLNAGLQVGYRLSNRWSLNTGLIYNKKYYKADGKDFKAPGWLSYVNLTSAEGNCSMIDIPINVRYDFSYNDKRRFFLSTGLTSYLMNHQTYDCYWIRPNGTNASASIPVDSNMNYALSVLNLSAGFERNLGNHFYFQAEPYLKLPLKGLGYGNMKLESYGIYFSVKYNPQFKKNAKSK